MINFGFKISKFEKYLKKNLKLIKIIRPIFKLFHHKKEIKSLLFKILSIFNKLRVK